MCGAGVVVVDVVEMWCKYECIVIRKMYLYVCV